MTGKAGRFLLVLLGLIMLTHFDLEAQRWVDTTYQIRSEMDSTYGQAIDFAGNPRDLKLDIYHPINDTPSVCGRPLMILIHGGAFLDGDKSAALLGRMATDFAKRGYVTANINYRLGMFQTERRINCNVTQLFNTPWNCMNQTDTAEWYRAWYRGVQDAKGALRYMLARKNVYNIDPRNVFIVGESAGAFIALGAGFLDDPAEKPIQCGAIASVNAPNLIYEQTCIQAYGFDTNVASMNLSRPDLGGIEGSIYLNYYPHKLKGVGDFFGATLQEDLFSLSPKMTQPLLYMFHQPNDLLVHIRRRGVLVGLSVCFGGLGCPGIINRPFASGSDAIRTLLDTLANHGQDVPRYQYDRTNNTADCALQTLNPALVGHAIDNFNLRTRNMATFFADSIETNGNCIGLGTQELELDSRFRVFPNPSKDDINVIPFDFTSEFRIAVFDIAGSCVLSMPWSSVERRIDLSSFVPGIYILELKQGSSRELQKIVKL